LPYHEDGGRKEHLQRERERVEWVLNGRFMTISAQGVI
jgi:hypothetical protein